MKILLLNGSPHEKGCTYTALSEVARELGRNGVDSEIHWIGNGDIPGCRACGFCKAKGRCAIDDDVNRVLDRIEEFDGFVFGAPVYYSGPAGQICSWMDRFFFCSRGRLDGRIAASVVNARRGGNTESFVRLNQYYLMNNMVVPGSQYWNQTHGNTPEQVEQDIEGLQTMRTLADNIAWLVRCIDAGRNAGIERPVREQKAFTNFIR